MSSGDHDPFLFNVEVTPIINTSFSLIVECWYYWLYSYQILSHTLCLLMLARQCSFLVLLSNAHLLSSSLKSIFAIVSEKVANVATINECQVCW